MRVLRIIVVWCLVALIWCICIVKGCAQNVPLIKVSHDSFVSYYDQQLKNPAIVCYVLEWKHFSGSNKIAGRHFKADTKLPKPIVLDKDFTGSGYVRGHLCSAGDRDSDKKWLKETYLTSNLVPMTMYCNSGPWKVIEDSCRALAKAGHRLIIARGPLYNRYPEPPAVRNTSQVRITIPQGFFSFAKCLDCGLTYQSWCLNSGTNSPQDVIQLRSGQPDGVVQLGTDSPQDVIQDGCHQLEHVIQNVAERHLLEQQRNTRVDPVALLFDRDERVSVLLQNIIGTWSREVYETITR